MDILSLYTTLANWTGWPLAFVIFLLVVSWGYWILNNRISLLQDHKDLLTHQLDEAKNFRPDIVASRLAERHKQLTEVIEMLKTDVQKNQEEIKKKQRELESTKAQIKLLAEQLHKANTLLYGNFPREGMVSDIVLQQLLLDIQLFSAIYIPVWPMGNVFGKGEDSVNKQGPFKIEEDTSMFQIHLGLSTLDGNLLGEIKNPYEDVGIYDNDYNTTLLVLFSPKRHISDDGLPEYNLPDTSKVIFRDGIPERKNDFTWFLKIPYSGDELKSILSMEKELS